MLRDQASGNHVRLFHRLQSNGLPGESPVVRRAVRSRLQIGVNLRFDARSVANQQHRHIGNADERLGYAATQQPARLRGRHVPRPAPIVIHQGC
jgi:hypothetical protein